MVNNIPTEFSADGGLLENRLRAEISLEYDKKLLQLLVEQEKQIRAQVTAQLVDQFAKPELTDIPAPVVTMEITDSKLFRCLDCGDAEFESASLLQEHRETLHADTAPKRGRKAKS